MKLFLKADKADIPVKEANENDKVVDDVKRERVETDDSTRLRTSCQISYLKRVRRKSSNQIVMLSLGWNMMQWQWAVETEPEM